MRTHNIPSCYTKSKRSLLFFLNWRFCQPSLARTTLSRTNFHGPKVFEPLKLDCSYFFCEALGQLRLRTYFHYDKQWLDLLKGLKANS